MSFANDLVKDFGVKIWQVKPTRIANARVVDEVAPDVRVLEATTPDPQIEYIFPKELIVRNIVLFNFRGTNLSQFREHSFAKVYLRLQEDKAIYLDNTLRSSYTSNTLTFDQIRLRLGPEEVLGGVRFDPGETAGDCFSVGPLEIFWRDN
jgi:hypothetical protein